MMKAMTLVVLLSIVLACGQDKLTLAVMDLDGDGIQQAYLEVLSDRLRSELLFSEQFEIVQRARMHNILQEQGLRLQGCTTPFCAAKVGRMIGVDRIVIGSMNKAEDMYSSYIRMVDVESGKVVKTVSVDCGECEIKRVISETIPELAKRLIEIKSKKNELIEITQVPKYRNTIT